jgi:hypothetical protein
MRLFIDDKEVVENQIEKIIHKENKIIIHLVNHGKKERKVLDNEIHKIEIKK